MVGIAGRKDKLGQVYSGYAEGKNTRIFLLALAASLLIHAAILAHNPNIQFIGKNARQQKVELVYIKHKPEMKEIIRMNKPEKEPFLKLSSKITAKRIAPPAFVEGERTVKEITRQNTYQRLIVDKPAFFKPEAISARRKITLPPVDLGKMNSPSYISYYQLVREKIRRTAYQSYTRTAVGEVYLSFIISSDGALRAIRLVEDKSSPNAYLKEVALKSVKDASPFPDFPKDLDYPELSFNVVISFELE